ncbi:MAG: apolipoprotein acyltransferase, partial [Planctomycetaceae bacterium]
MSNQPDLQARCRDAAGMAADASVDDQTLIGFFQRFRPDGSGLIGLYEGLPRGQDYQRRLADLFLATGDDRREGGGRDAYFVVRNPEQISPDVAEHQAAVWLESLRRIARRA